MKQLKAYHILTYILFRKRNAKILKHHCLEKNHCDGIFSDITYEYFQQAIINQN